MDSKVESPSPARLGRRKSSLVVGAAIAGVTAGALVGAMLSPGGRTVNLSAVSHRPAKHVKHSKGSSAICNASPALPKLPVALPGAGAGTVRVAGEGGYVLVRGSTTKGVEICFKAPTLSGLPGLPGGSGKGAECFSTPAGPKVSLPGALADALKVGGAGGYAIVRASSSKGLTICFKAPSLTGLPGLPGLPGAPKLPAAPKLPSGLPKGAECFSTPAAPKVALPGALADALKVGGEGGYVIVRASSSKGLTICFKAPTLKGLPALPTLPGVPGLPALPGLPSTSKSHGSTLPSIPGLPKLPTKLPALPIKLPALPVKLPSLPALPVKLPALPGLGSLGL